MNIEPVRASDKAQLPGINGILIAVFTLAVTAAIVFGLMMGYRSGPAQLDQDELEYWNLGRDLLTSGTFPAGRRTPVFPLIIGLLQQALGNFTAVSIAVSVLSAASAPLLAMLAYRFTGNRLAAMLAGLAMALWPPGLFFGTSLYSEAIALPMFLGFLLLLPRPGPQGEMSTGRLVMAGALLGLCALTRPMYLLFLPVLALVLLADLRAPAKAIRAFAVTLAGFFMLVLPWSIHATTSTGHPMLISVNGGETLAGGFNGRLLAMDQPDEMTLERRVSVGGPGKWIAADETGYLTAQDRTLSYFEQDKVLRSRAVAWMIAHPGGTFYLWWKKLAYMWGLSHWESSGTLAVVFGNAPIIALQILFFWALATNRDLRRRGARYYLLPLFVIGVATISWGSWRFRQPADAGMLLVVAVALAARLSQRAQRAQGTALPPGSSSPDPRAIPEHAA